MHCKKNLMLLLAVFALVVPLMFAGNAFAIYAGDGSKPNGTTGTWDITDYGKCVYGIDASGNITTGTETSRPDCIAHLFTDTTDSTSAGCQSFTNAEGISHYWNTTCLASNGTNTVAVSLNGLDRTATMCAQAAAAQGLTNATWTSACIASWVYTGPNNDGLGFEPNSGFCYIAVDVTGDYPGGQTACPTSTNGYSWNSTLSACLYAYGIKGTLGTQSSNVWSALKKKDTATVYVAAHSAVDLTGLTQGQCLANGASWSTGAVKSGTQTLGSGAVIATVTNTRAGCMECHNRTSQNNSMAERWKDTYILTGHKNMLRKVTTGNIWKGPDANGNLVDYATTGSAVGAINWNDAANGNIATAATPTVYPLLYLFGDWMAAAPGGLDVIVNVGGAAKYNGTNSYSCANCHTAGWRSNSNAGLCVTGATVSTTLTTSATCSNAGGNWIASSGVEGGTGAEPAASTSTTGWNGTWDRDGIVCSRCHSSVFAVAGTNANGSAFTGPQDPTQYGAVTLSVSGHNNTPSNAQNERVNNICFGCHQSIAKVNNNTGTAVDLGNPAQNIPVASSSTFGSHPLGNEFLNSVHARYSVTSGNGMTPNVFGKYNLVGNTVSQYNSDFRGFVCRSSTSSAGGNVLKTVIKSGVEAEIKSRDDCNVANGLVSGSTETRYWQAESQGACTTCHDVHNSMFTASGGDAMKKECETCHEATTGAGYLADMTTIGKSVPQITDDTTLAHPRTANTPFDSAKFGNACETCHMPKSASSEFPMHLWRISTDPNYFEFPQNYPTVKVAQKANDDHGYSAVWVDLDYACGQCHYSAGLNYTSGNPVFDKTQLAAAAAGLHSGSTATTDPATRNAACLTCHSTGAGGAPVITPGTNHHSGEHSGGCVACHPQPHTGAPIAVRSGHVYANNSTDADNFCLSCHGNTGSHAHHHVTGALVGVKNCSDCHNKGGVAPTDESNTACMQCHNQSWNMYSGTTLSTPGGTVRAVVQGTDHHNGECITCHTEGGAYLAISAWTKAGVAAPNINALTKKLQSRETPTYYYWSIDTTLSTACLGCHSTFKTKAAGGSTIAIVPSGAADNHHNGHSSMPGTSFGGVAGGVGTVGSRGDNDPGMNCLGCHGKATITGGDSTNGYTLKFAASGLSTSTVAAANGRTDTSGLCMGCHEMIQSGSTQDHHAGVCTTCHHTDGTFSGTYAAGVSSSTNWPAGSDPTNCQNCHSIAQGTKRAVNQGIDHHNGTCTECHGEAGGVSAWTIAGVSAPNIDATVMKHNTRETPNFWYWSVGPASGTSYITSACLGCHSKSQPKLAGGMTGTIIPSGTSDNHHGGHSSVPGSTFGGVDVVGDDLGTSAGSRGENDPGMNCLGCHGKVTITGGNATSGYNMKFAASGLSTSTVASQNTRTNTTGLCLGCHEVEQGVMHHNGDCITCHHPDGSWSGTYPAGVGSGVNVLSTITTTSDRAVIATYCTSCHSSSVTKKAGGTARAIIVSGTGDNHHRGSNTKTSALGSKYDVTMAGCLYCHGEAGGVPFGGVDTEAMQDQRFTGSCSGACHTTVVQLATAASWTTGAASHHDGACLTCHNPAAYSGTYPPGVTDAGTLASLASAAGMTVPGNSSASCLNCHKNNQTSVASGATLTAIVPNFGPGKNHHGGVPGETDCIECHGEAGGLSASFGGYSYTNSNMCLTCHQNYPYPNAVVPAVSHHGKYEANCVECHSTSTPLDGSKITGPGVIPVVANCTGCHTGQYAVVVNHGTAVLGATTTERCQKCHDSSGLVSGVATTNNAGVLPTSLQVACGQCHGGSDGSTATHNGAPYKDLAEITDDAQYIHAVGGRPTAVFSWTTSTTADYVVSFDASASYCPSGSCTYTWSPSISETGAVISHNFASSATVTVTLTVASSSGSATKSLAVTPRYIAASGTGVSITSVSNSGGSTVNYTISGGKAPYTLRANWGDGTIETSTVLAAGSGSVGPHTYTKVGNFTMLLTAVDSGDPVGVNVSTFTTSTTIVLSSSTYTVSGLVTRVNGTTPVGSANLLFYQGASLKKSTYTAANGTYKVTGMLAGTYTVRAVKSGLIFSNPTATVTVTGDTTANMSSTN